MTVVVALPFLSHLVVFADSRVSYEEYPDTYDDVLQKLYAFGNPQTGFRVVVGFAGPLRGAYEVIDGIRKTAKSYSKPPVASSLMPDMVRWIKHEYSKLSDIDGRNLSFLLAGVEPSRDISAEKPNWIPFFPQMWSTTLIPSKREPKKLVQQKRGIIKAIGYRKKEFVAECEQLWQTHFNLLYKYPEIGMNLIIEDLMLFFMKHRVESVGGLFQCANLSVDGVKWLSYGTIGDISLKFERNQYFQSNAVSGELVPLMSIFNWKKKRLPPGDYGIFEDPIHVRIVSELQGGAEEE